MSTHMRAALIAMLGPAVSVLGIAWVLANALIDTGRELSLRYVAFDSGHLVITAGIIISVICIPVAREVAAAEPEDVELQLFEPDPARQRAEGPVATLGDWGEATEWE